MLHEKAPVPIKKEQAVEILKRKQGKIGDHYDRQHGQGLPQRDAARRSLGEFGCCGDCENLQIFKGSMTDGDPTVILRCSGGESPIAKHRIDHNFQQGIVPECEVKGKIKNSNSQKQETTKH
jgi:hypothetical protein